MDNETLFTKTSPTRLFFTAALPGAVSMLASAAYNVCEGLFVGRFIGETAFAAVNLAMPLVIINYAIADLLGVGSSVPISIALGRGDTDEANNIFSCTTVLIVAAGLATGALLFFGAPLFFALMGAEGELASQAVAFLRMNAVWSPITTIMYAVDNYLRICGRIKRSTFINVLMSVLGIALEVVFLGVFRWGVWAAGLAFSVATFIAVIVAYVPFFRRELQLRFVRPRFSHALVRRVVSDGIPTFLNNVASQLTAIVINYFLLAVGGADAVAIYGMVMYLDGVVLPILYGMLDSLQPAVGFNWGRKDVHRVKQIELHCFGAAAVVALVSVVVINAVPEAIVHFFLADQSAEFVAESVRALRLFSLGMAIRWFGMAVQSMLVALSQPRLASLISIANAFVFPMALIWLLRPLGLLGMWLNFPGAVWLSSALAAFLLVHFRKELRLGNVEVGR